MQSLPVQQLQNVTGTGTELLACPRAYHRERVSRFARGAPTWLCPIFAARGQAIHAPRFDPPLSHGKKGFTTDSSDLAASNSKHSYEHSEKVLEIIQKAGKESNDPEFDQEQSLDIEQLVLLNRYEDAWKLFHSKAKRGEVNTRDCNLVIKMCEDSNAIIHHIKFTMRVIGIKPDIVTFTHLVRQLVVEGKKSAARKIVKHDMRKHGIYPNKYTRRTLEMTEYEINRIRQAQARSKQKKTLPSTWQNFDTLLREKKHKIAWRQFREKMQKGNITLIECNMMMKGCYNSKQMREFMSLEMKKAGIKPNVMTFTSLIRELILEGDIQGAKRVLSVDMKEAGVQPDTKTWETIRMPNKELQRLRHIKIKNLLKIRQNEAYSAASDFLNHLIRIQQANIKHCTQILKTLPDSKAVRVFMETVLPKAGLSANATCYNILIGRLVIEGKDEEAKSVFYEEMPDRGIQPIERTRKLLNIKPGIVDRMRTQVLRDLMNRDGPEFEAGREYLTDRVKGIDSKVDVTFFNVMVKACEDSAAMRKLIETTMKEAGVKPSMATFSLLARQLMIEGDLPGAQGVIYQEMPAADILPNKRARDILDLPSNDLTRLRASYIQKLLHSNTEEATDKAWDFFFKLIDRDEADQYVCTLMLKCCPSSDQMRAFIEVTMKKSGVKPDSVTYTLLLQKMIAEGKISEAIDVVKYDIPRTGVNPDIVLQDIIKNLELPDG